MAYVRPARWTWVAISSLGLLVTFQACSAKDPDEMLPAEAGSGAGPTTGRDGGSAGGAVAGAPGGEGGAAAAGASGQAAGGAEAAGAAGEGGAPLSDDFGPTSRETLDAPVLAQLEAPLRAVTDGAGNVLLLIDETGGGQRVEKYDAKLAHVWTLPVLTAQSGDPVTWKDLAMSANDALLLTGSTASALAGEDADAGPGLVLARYTSDKQRDFLTKVPGSLNGSYVSAAPGHPVVWGDGDALPGQPVDVLGGPFLAHFDQAGALRSAKQGGDYRSQTVQAVPTPDGGLYIINEYVDSNNVIARYDADGTSAWEVPSADEEGFSLPPYLASGPSNDAYALVTEGFACSVARLSTAGASWWRMASARDFAATDTEPPGQGYPASCDAIAAAGSDVYVAGTYVTTTDTGGGQLPFVARLTATGKQRWFSQLVPPGDSANSIAFLLPAARGDVLAIDVTGAVFKLRGSDGKPLAADGEPL